jgi:hypothetical protein
VGFPRVTEAVLPTANGLLKLGQEDRFKNQRHNLTKRTGAGGDKKTSKSNDGDSVERGFGES